MKFKAKIKRDIYNWLSMLRRPDTWFQSIINDNRKLSRLILIGIAFIALGVTLELHWSFPYFYGFVSCFLFIGTLSFWSVLYFSKKMKNITAAIANQPSAKKANLFYFRYCVNSPIYVGGPLIIIFIFGAGGCLMFGALQLTPTFIWALLLFFFVVYISIIGYLQYIVLALYIRNLAYGSGKFRQLPKSMIECVPAQLEWLQEITRLSHTYRTSFFTLGSAYILAYQAFCSIPEMHANISSPIYFFLWGIIVVVIVLLFPAVSVLEYQWIKLLVNQLKACYINDLTYEKELKIKANTSQFPPTFQRLAQTFYAMQILNSKDYPLNSAWTSAYAILLSLFNLITTTITIVQGIPTLSNVLPHIF